MNKSRYFTPLLSATFAAVLSLGLGVSANAADSAKHTVSRQIGKDLQQAQEDEKKGNYRDALEKLKA